MPFVMGFILAESAGASPACETVFGNQNQNESRWKASNPYVVLGLSNDASFEEAKTAYRKLAMTFHPDRYSNTAQATMIMQSLNAAFAKIKKNPNPEKPRARETEERRAEPAASPPESQKFDKTETYSRVNPYERANEIRAHAIVAEYDRLENLIIQNARLKRSAAILELLRRASRDPARMRGEDVSLYITNTFFRFMTSQPSSAELMEFAKFLQVFYPLNKNSRKPALEILLQQIERQNRSAL